MAVATRRPLTVRVGEDLEALADDLAAHLGTAHHDVLASDMVVVPTPGIGRWLEERLSRRLGASLLGDGVCANVEFLLWGNFLRRLLGQRDEDADEWSIGSMSLVGLGIVVDAHEGAARLVPDQPGTLRYPIARVTADLFDQLFRWRPDVADQWLEGRSNDPRAALLRELRERSDEPPPHWALRTAIQRLAEGDDVGRLPACIHVFGGDSIAGGPMTPAVLDALCTWHEVVVHLVTTSVARFERLRASTAAWSASPPDRGGDEDNLAEPLLVRSWGTNSADAARLVAQLPARPTTSVVAMTSSQLRPSTLLATLQDSLRGRPVDPRAPDATVAFHSCVGAVRQVEAARDAILHALLEDPSLRPSQIGIFCADLPRFAPYVEAVLGSPEGAPSIPYVLRDRSLSRASPYVATVDAALQLLGGRMPRSALIDLIRSPFVQRRFSLDLDDVDRISSWAESAAVRWGFDGAQRSSMGLPESFDAGTWRRALDRLLAGVALGSDTGSPVLEVRPIDVGHDLDRVDALCDVLGTIGRLRDACDVSRTVAEWCEIATNVADSLLSPARDDLRSASLLRTLLDGVATDARTTDVPVAFEEFTAIFSDRASGERELVATGSSGITVTSFLPLRNVPFKVLVLLGLDEVSLPHQPSLDVAFGAPRVGDRDRSADLRGALLAAVLSTGSRLIATHDGRDVVTNDAIAPSTVLSELMDAIASVCTRDLSALVHEHPRHAHGHEDLLAHDSPRPFGFDRGALQRALELGQSDLAVVGARIRGVRGEVQLAERTHRDELVGFLTAPQRTYLASSLAVRLPPRVSTGVDELPTDVDDLERWKIVNELVAIGLREGTGEGWAAACDAWAGEVDSPLSCIPGRLGELALHGDDGVAARAKLLSDAVARFEGDATGEWRTVEVELADGSVLHGEIAVHRGDTTLSWTASASDTKLRVASSVDLLLLTASHPETRWRAVRVWREGRRKSVSALTLTVPGDTPAQRADAAVRGLESLMALRHTGLREPIPLFLNVSRRVLDCLIEYPDADAEELAAAGLAGWSSTWARGDAADLAVRYCFDGTYDDLLAEPCRPGDPDPHPKAGGSRLLAYSLAFLDGLLDIDRTSEVVLAT